MNLSPFMGSILSWPCVRCHSGPRTLTVENYAPACYLTCPHHPTPVYTLHRSTLPGLPGWASLACPVWLRLSSLAFLAGRGWLVTGSSWVSMTVQAWLVGLVPSCRTVRKCQTPLGKGKERCGFQLVGRIQIIPSCGSVGWLVGWSYSINSWRAEEGVGWLERK